jgi:hypothetical protein
MGGRLFRQLEQVSWTGMGTDGLSKSNGRQAVQQLEQVSWTGMGTDGLSKSNGRQAVQTA